MGIKIDLLKLTEKELKEMQGTYHGTRLLKDKLTQKYRDVQKFYVSLCWIEEPEALFEDGTDVVEAIDINAETQER